MWMWKKKNRTRTRSKGTKTNKLQTQTHLYTRLNFEEICVPAAVSAGALSIACRDEAILLTIARSRSFSWLTSDCVVLVGLNTSVLWLLPQPLPGMWIFVIDFDEVVVNASRGVVTVAALITDVEDVLPAESWSGVCVGEPTKSSMTVICVVVCCC